MQWFVNALCTLFELIFNNVLSPILTEILTIYVNYYTNVIWILLADVLLGQHDADDAGEHDVGADGEVEQAHHDDEIEPAAADGIDDRGLQVG